MAAWECYRLRQISDPNVQYIGRNLPCTTPTRRNENKIEKKNAHVEVRERVENMVKGERERAELRK